MNDAVMAGDAVVTSLIVEGAQQVSTRMPIKNWKRSI
jgi:hypothetical protein